MGIFNTQVYEIIASPLNVVLLQILVVYRIRGNFCGMKFSLSRKQTGFSQLYFRGSQVHHGEVARVMYCYKSLIVAN